MVKIRESKLVGFLSNDSVTNTLNYLLQNPRSQMENIPSKSSKSSKSQIIKKLKLLGWIEKEGVPGNDLKKMVFLTPKGQKAISLYFEMRTKLNDLSDINSTFD